MDTLSIIRKVQRKIDSLKRKDLKHRMDGYNSLARSTSSTDSRRDEDSPDTIHDISQQLIESIKTRNTRHRFVRRQTQVDRVLSHVVCDEVRQTWNNKLHAHKHLSDENRQTLLNMSSRSSINSLRESKLNDVTKWMVFQWTEGEGYDPAKHVRRLLDVQTCTKYECEHVHVV